MCSIITPARMIMSSTESPEDGGGAEAEEERRGTKRKISLTDCAVCGSHEAKYRCPACLTHSCSISCVKKHKEDSGCSGVRSKTAFVTLSHFDEMALLNDYRFLEDAGRFADGTTRDKLVLVPRTTTRAKKMVSGARKMNITLRLLPVTFTKSRENSTIFLAKEKQFLWHLKLMFPQSSSEFTQRRVSDQKTLEKILTAYIHPTESDPVTRQKLKLYVHSTLDHVKVFMKAEGGKANSVRYHQLELKKSLRDNLSCKVLVEYPALHVVLKEQWKNYPIKEPAEPAPTCRFPATKNIVADREAEAEIRISRARAADPSAKTQEATPVGEPLQGKKKHKGRGEDEEEEQEEGEITDSSDDDDDEGEESVSCDKKSCDDARSPAKDASVIAGETAGCV
ncbi:unnamed protein product [Ophioblennius macclurei]